MTQQQAMGTVWSDLEPVRELVPTWTWDGIGHNFSEIYWLHHSACFLFSLRRPWTGVHVSLKG